MTTTAPPETFAGGADRQGLEDRRATLLRHLHLNRDDFDATEELRSVERALARLPRPEGIWAWQRREQRRGAQ